MQFTVGENTVSGTNNGVYVSGEGSNVSFTGKTNTITVDDSNVEKPGDTSGVHVVDGGQYIITKNEGNNTSIDVMAHSNKAYGIFSENEGIVNIDTNDFIVNLTNEAEESTTGGTNNYGILAEQGSVTVNSTGKVELNSHNNAKTNINNSYGIWVVSGNTISETTTTFKDAITKINAEEIKITTTTTGLSSYPGAVGIATDNGVGGYYYDNDKKTLLTLHAMGGNGITIEATSEGSSTGVQAVQNNSEVNIIADNGDVKITATGGEAWANNGIYVNSSQLVNSSYDVKTAVTVQGVNNIITGSGTGSGIHAEYGKSVVNVTANGGNNTITGGNIGIYSGYGAQNNVTALQGQNNITGSTSIYAAYGGNVKLNAGKNIANGSSYGLYACYDNSSIMLQGKTGNEVKATGESGYAIRSYGTNANVSLTTLEGDNILTSAYKGIYAQSNGTVNLFVQNGNNSVTTSESLGIDARSSGTASLNAKKGSNKVISSGSTAIYSNSANVSLLAEAGNTVNGTTGLWGLSKGEIALGTRSGNNEVTANGTYGVYGDSDSKIELTSDLANNILKAGTVDEKGYGNGYAIYAQAGSTVSLQAGILNELSGAVRAIESGTSVSMSGVANKIYSAAAIANAGGLTDTKVISALYAENGAKINVTGNNTILSYADVDKPEDLERVVWAYKTADIAIDGTTIISTDTYDKSTNSNDIAIAAGTATGLNKDLVDAYVPDRATVSVKYDTTSTITGDILSAYAGQVDITPKNDTAQMHITGNILAGNNGVLNVNLGNGGTLTGRADDYGDAGVIDNSGHGTEFFDPAFSSDIFKGGEVNLTMGNNSRWNVTGQSWITRINTEDSSNAIIDLVSANTDKNSSAHALTVYEMNGDAVFNMSLDADRTVSDMVYMKNATSEYVVNVVDPVTQADMYAGKSEGGIFDGLRFATVGKGSKASFRAITWDQGVNNIEYEVGTDSYDTSDENHHYDSSTGNGAGDMEKPGTDLVEGFFGSEGTPGAQEAPANGIMMMAARADEGMGTNTDANGTEVGETTNFKLIGVKSSEISDAGKTVVAMSLINYSNAIYMDRMNKRMGEARYIDGDEGLWVRMRHDRIGKSDAFRSMNTMMELGYDTRVNDREDGEHRQGVAIDYMRGTADYKNVAGEGDVRRGGIWFYDAWLGNKGHYTDYVLKFGRLSNDFELYTRTLGEKVTGDYSNFVYSASAEYGRKKDLGNNWYIEPQAQIQYAHVTDADYTTSQDTHVQLDAIDSLIGRVGFRLGKDVGEKSTFYITM